MKKLSRSVQATSTAILFGLTLNANSAITDLANAPLITSPTSSVLPNVFLMLDDSGSMAWDYMPDNAGNFGNGTYGAASSQCNGVFYDPTITYTPPVDATGALYTASTFTSAWNDGYNTAGGSTNLSTSFRPTGGTAAPAYYYKYTGTQTTEKLKDYYNTSSTFYRECNSAVGSTPGSGVFTKVTVSTTSGPGNTDERTNFANWWSYYHTRILMMKTATGKAFSSIGPTFRVGFASINNNNNNVLALNTFDATQKALWYAKLYGATTGNSTPLREALSDVGRMYAHLLPTTNSNSGLTSSLPDPIQFSCQQNFTILTTDGFWNGSTTYKLNGSTVGNQDYFEPRPMYDGSNIVQTITTPYTTEQQRKTISSGGVTTKTWGKTTTTINADCPIPGTPPGATSAPMLDTADGSHYVGIGDSGSSTTNPNSNRCFSIGTNSATVHLWFCRGSSGNNPATGYRNATATDGAGVTYYVVSSGAGNSGCTSDNTAFGSSYSTTQGACPGTSGTAGKNVTTTHYTQNETISGATTTSVDLYTANQSTTQTISNGIVGAVSALTPSTLTYSFTRNISSSSTAATSDTCGGQNAPCPSTSGTWTTATTSTVCTPTTSLPTAGTTAPIIESTVSTGGTSSTTVLSTVGPTAGTPSTTTGSASGGTSNTLADVAEYYYITDLRTSALGNNLSGAAGAVNGTDISDNNVPSSGLDAASHQHMTTFTLGLGARGRMVFDPAYNSATSGDFYAVKQGSTASTTSGICTWQANGTTCNWPFPASDAIENIDDLWHAAVNGRGTYFSAANPTGLATALSSALAGVSARTGSAAAATTSNAFVTQGDNFLFRSTFVSQKWTGELIRQQLDITTGAVLSTIDWSAQTQLDANASRNIYFYDSAATNKLSSFTLANLTSAGLNAYFNWSYISSTAPTTLSQLCTVGSTCLPIWAANTSYPVGSVYRNGTTWYKVNTTYTSGATFGTTDTTNSSVSGVADVNLVNFIRGDRTYEGASTDLTKFYRQRDHVMGDIVNSETTYVKGALSPSYSDPGYAAHITTMADRQSMVYVGANDGMLHAFYAADGIMSSTTGHTVSTGGVTVTGGQEAWAFIPTAVIPNLYHLADKSYSSQHQFYADGSPVTADICVSNCTTAASAVWKTILVGGLNGGGSSYYALDITNPAQPKALWQFTDANMGYTYGNPKVVKLKNGTWVALLTSGYNNTSGDGQGYLYVINAYTGTLIRAIGTGVGSATTPSGLGKLDTPLATPGVDATALAAYAGDMQGNLWRFDINGDLGAAGYEAQLLATLKDANGKAQPITTKPLLSMVDTTLVVFVGTGRYLGSTDLADTSQQTFYSIKDTALSDTVQIATTPSVAILGNPRTYAGAQGAFVQQTLTSKNCPIGSPANICTSGQTVVTSSNNAVSYASNGGWYVDFPLAGERVNVDPAIIDRTLIVVANVPNASSCSVGGDSYQYQFDYKTGSSVSSSYGGVVAVKLGNELSTRSVIATLSSGVNMSYTQGSGGGTPSAGKVWSNSNGGNVSTVNGSPSRQSWRLLIQQ